MKSKKVLGLILIQGMMLTSAHAIFIDRGEVPRASVRTGVATSGVPARPLDTAGTTSRETPGTPSLVCNKHTIGDYLSLGFLYNLVDYPDDITLRRTDRNTVILRIPKHVSACLHLDFEFRNVGSDKIVAMKNSFRFTEANTGLSAEEIEGATHDEKYAACLKQQNLLVETGPNQYAFNRAEAESTQQVAYSVETEFPLSLEDATQSMRLYFASPKARSYSVVYGTNNVPESPREWPCLETEQFQEPAPYLYVSEEDKLAQSAMVACESNDYEKILSELRELRRSSAGNANELIMILEDALTKARNTRVAEIYERLEEIEREFAPSREDIAAGRKTGVSENRARTLGREYGTLLEEVNRVLYDPAIQEINRLQGELDSGNVTDGRRERITARVRELNEQIGQFSTKDQRNLGNVFNGLREYGLNNEALKIEGFRLKSLNFSRVHPEGERRTGSAASRPLTIAQADENIKRSLETFETTILRNWDDEYRVRQGDSTPIVAAQRSAQQRWTNMQNQYRNFVQREQSEMQRVCASNFIGGVRNPVACQRYMSGQQQRQRQFAQRWESGMAQIQAESQRVTMLNQTYDEAMREIASMREANPSAYGDDPFGFYTNPYDSSYLYSIGGQQQFQYNYNPMGGFAPQQQQPMPMQMPQGQAQPQLMPAQFSW